LRLRERERAEEERGRTMSLSFHRVCIGRKYRNSLAVGARGRGGLAGAAAVEDEAERAGGAAASGDEVGEARCAWTWARRAGGVMLE